MHRLRTLSRAAARTAALACAVASASAQAGIVFTPHLSEYSRLPQGQYTEMTFISTRIEAQYNREGEKVHLGAPFIGPGDHIDAALVLLKYLWIGNVFRDSWVPYLDTHSQFCRAIGTAGWQQASGAAVRRSNSAGMHAGAAGQGDLFVLCGVYGDEHLWGPIKTNGLLATTVKFPIGHYDQRSLLNVGTNYWSYIPQLATHTELWDRVLIDATAAYQINGDNDSPAFGGLTPTRPADVMNLEGNLAWKFTEHWFADVGYSWRKTRGPNRFDKYSLTLKDQPVQAQDACNNTNTGLNDNDPTGGLFGGGFVTPEMCNAGSAFFISPRPGPYEDRGIQGTLVTAGLYYIYRTSTVLQARVAVPIEGRGGQIDTVYDVYAGVPDGNGGFTRGSTPISTTGSRQNTVQEAASVAASPYLELRFVYLFWAP
ncbi:MAG TPA: transporter [Candidatus Binatia bacterium]|nr:transporter [Candidatus Binatia bacterium]